jgi:hypothetical protein
MGEFSADDYELKQAPIRSVPASLASLAPARPLALTWIMQISRRTPRTNAKLCGYNQAKLAITAIYNKNGRHGLQRS